MQEAANRASEFPRKRLRDDVVDQFVQIMPDRSRRARTVVNYAEAHHASGGGMRITDVVLSAVDQLKLDMGPLGSCEACWAGADALLIAQYAQSRLDKEHIPMPTVRLALMHHLRSGRLRRRLASPAAATPGGGGGRGGGGMLATLKMLVLNTLQVENDRGAPWALPPLVDSDPHGESDAPSATAPAADGGDGGGGGDDGGGGGGGSGRDGAVQRMHVWKGVTPLRLATLQGAALVRRRVAVWWAGTNEWVCATVTGYNDGERRTGYADGAAGSHVLVYDGGGLRAIERLEGRGEPLVWRLLEDGNGGGGGGGGGAGDLLAEAEFDWPINEVEEPVEEEPPIRVTLRAKGCDPVGTVGTAAYAARLARHREAEAGTKAEAASPDGGNGGVGTSNAAGEDSASACSDEPASAMAESLVGSFVQVFWELDLEWYTCEVLDFVAAEGTFLVEYVDDGLQVRRRSGPNPLHCG